jgi:hypothetical protein
MARRIGVGELQLRAGRGPRLAVSRRGTVKEGGELLWIPATQLLDDAAVLVPERLRAVTLLMPR